MQLPNAIGAYRRPYSGLVVAIPPGTSAPSFTIQPSISPATGSVGTVFSGSDGYVNNGSVSARQWFLNGSAISGANGASYTSTASGTLTYQVTATGAGGTASATSAGASVSGFTPGYTPPAVTLGQSHIYDLGTPSYIDTLAGANDIADSYLDLMVDVAPDSVTDSGNRCLYAVWRPSFRQTGNYCYMLCIYNGKLAIAYNGVAQPAQFPASTVPLSSVMAAGERRALRVVLNASGSAKNGFAPATATFFTAPVSASGVVGTYTQLGAVVACDSAGFPQAGGTVSPVFGTLDGGNPFYGRLFKAKLVDSAGVVRANPDHTALPLGKTGTFTDTAATPNTWTLQSATVTDTYSNRTATTYPRLTRTGSLRMKGLVLTPKGAAAQGSWGKAWAQYNSADFDARMAYAKSLGANTVKTFTAGISAGDYPNMTIMEANIADFCALARKYGLYITIDLSTPDDVNDGVTPQATKVATLIAYLNLWMKYAYDRLIYVCVCGELQFGYPRPTAYTAYDKNNPSINATEVSDLAVLMAECRKAAPDMPLGLSTYMSQASEYGASNGITKAVAALASEFTDLDCYDGTNTRTDLTTNDTPKTANFTTLEGTPQFVGAHLASEIGLISDNSEAVQTAFINAIAAIAQMPKSRGACLFGDVDFYPTDGSNGRFGITGHPAMVAAFQSWPTP